LYKRESIGSIIYEPPNNRYHEGSVAITNPVKFVYPAFIKKTMMDFLCFFPTLFPEAGWDFPLSTGETRYKAIQNAKKDLAYSLP